MLEIRGLVVRYGAIEAVRGVDLAVAEGEIVALLGANGAGKTTTLAAIAGLVPIAGGEVRYDGHALAGLSPEAVSRLKIALVPEGRRVFADLSVRENLLLGGAAHARGAQREALREALERRFPILSERAWQRAGLLSGGEQQMLAIARALMSAPKLLLLDEPSLGLAPRMVDRVFELIVELRRDGHTILLVEQNVPRSLEIADRGIVLANGRVALQGTAAELSRSELVREAYLAA